MSRRILIFSLAYHPVIGGAEVAVKEITDRIGDARLNDTVGQVEFDMVTLRFDPSHPATEKIGNVNVYRIDSSKMLFPIEATLFAKVLHKERQYEAVWAIMAARAGAAALFFKYAHPEVRFILNLQEGDPIWYMKLRSLYYINPFFRKIFSNADKVQAISNYLADYARIMGHKGKVEVIPNGVDINKFKNQESRVKNQGQVTLITTSRLVEKNGVGDLIKAMKLLPKNVHLKILGVGPLESKLKQLAASTKQLEARIEFLGMVDQDKIPGHLHKADIFVRPSLSEGLGISFIEAMAAGLPIIATPVGGIVDFLEHGRTGLFCEPKDPESIAKQVQRLIDDPKLIQTLIDNGQKLVKEKYDWDLIAKEMEGRVFNIS